MKKVLLLVVALAALALPASASAYDTWTVNGEDIAEGDARSQTYTVKQHSYFSPWGWGQKGSWLTCNVSIELTAVGGEAPYLTTARISQFNQQSGTCNGSGSLDDCDLNEATTSSNVGEGWNISHGAPMKVTNVGGNEKPIAMQWGLKDCSSYPNHTYYQSYYAGWEFIPTVNGEGQITEVMLKGQGYAGLPYNWGPFVVDGTPELGLK